MADQTDDKQPPKWTPEELNFIAWMEKGFIGRKMTEQEINLSLAQARYMMGESWIDDDFGSADSQRTPAELEIIEFMQKCKGESPLTEQEINLGLEQARALGEL
jgi:hypothetical protein